MTTRALGRRLAATLVAGAALALVAAPAHAQTAADGLWYFDVLNVQAAHEAGWTGEGVTIAVLDSPINPDIPTLRDADIRVDDEPQCYADGNPIPPVTTGPAAQHGTNVVSLIVGSGAEGGVKGVAPDASILYYAVLGEKDVAGDAEPCLDSTGEATEAPVARALTDAVERGADIISMSLGFNADDGVFEAVTLALREGVILVASLPNQQSGSADEFFNFSDVMNGAVNVQALDRNGAVQTHLDLTGQPVPNADPNVDVAAPGLMILQQGDGEGDWSRQSFDGGTSLATPIVSGFLAAVSQKYPEATANQLLQSLIRNTGSGDHEPIYDESQQIGYGVVSLTHMLANDPTQYDDVNPLFTADGTPSAADLESIDSPWTPAPVPDAPAVPNLVVPLAIAGGLALVVAVGVVVTVLIVRRRARA